MRNNGASTVEVTLSIGGTLPAAFELTSPATQMVAPGVDVVIAVRFRSDRIPSSGATAAPPADGGGVVVDAVLSATSGGSSARANLFGLAMTQPGAVAGGEPTLGQILKTVGFKVNVGQYLESRLNTSEFAAMMHGEEVNLTRFVKAGDGPVVLRVIARFSPSGPMPYGYYTAAAANCADAAQCTRVGTMATNTDANTSNGARMIHPPLDAMGMVGTFDPGGMPFGIWSFTEQADTGNASYGNYLYSEPALNAPANRRRVRVWPLRDRTGTMIANSFLLGCEEAANDDYQDYLFTLSNVRAP